MITLLTIIQYFFAAVLDVSDKFLISSRKIKPASYTFFTVVTGAALLFMWPFVYNYLPAKWILLNLLSGAFFSVTLYVFFRTLSEGEVSRVIPFVFGLVPVFDIFLAAVTGHGNPTLQQFAALFLLIPGAILISYRKNFSGKHIGQKVLVAFLFSTYFFLWKFGAQEGGVLNNLMWNRLGAALALILPLVFVPYRKAVFTHEHVHKKKQTSILFLLKQAVGGANFVFNSYLLSVGTIAVVNALQGFRYAFLLIGSAVLSKKYSHIISEDTSKHLLKIKFAALGLIFLGTVILFL